MALPIIGKIGEREGGKQRAVEAIEMQTAFTIAARLLLSAALCAL